MIMCSYLKLLCCRPCPRDWVIIILLTFNTSLAQAQWHGGLSLLSDWVDRGISQTANKPALQGTLSYALPHGLNSKVFISPVEFASGARDIQTDLTLSLSLPHWHLTPGVTHSLFQRQSAENNSEWFIDIGLAELTWPWLISWDAQVATSPALPGNPSYIETRLTIDVGGDWQLITRLGRQFSDIDAEYYDWETALRLPTDYGDIGLSYTDTELNDDEFARARLTVWWAMSWGE